MAKHRIAWLPGDGIGNDVMDAAKLVLDTLQLDAEYIHGDIGWEFWKSEGNPLPDRTIEILRTTDCALFGAITSKPKNEAAKELDPELQGKGYVYSSPIVGLRQLLNLHTNMRPCHAFEGNPLNYKDGIDLVIFRENTEGMYAGIEFRPMPRELRETMAGYNPKMRKFDAVEDDDMAVTLRVITRKGAEAIIKDAYSYAHKHNKPTVTVVEKANVLRETSGLFLEVARDVAKDYPDIEMWVTNIDAMCMWLVKNPEKYGVIVTSNLFGDITSDLSAQLVGGLGFACAANIGDDYAVFEPTHGSAPKYAGKAIANPTAMILSVRLMLQYLKEDEMADRVYSSVTKVLREGIVRTKDMGGTATTMEMAEAIAANL
jgi:isocitrate/isopropylmalate dehydrogenase